MAHPRTLVAALAVAVTLTLGSCSLLEPTPAPTPEASYEATGDGVLRIGTLFGLTGSQTGTAPAQVAAVELAVRDINLAGGYNGAPVELFHRNSADDDSGNAAGVALTSLAALVEKGVDVVIGPSSTSVAAALAPAAAEAGIPLILASDARPADAAADAALFSTAPAASRHATALVEAIAGTGAESLAIVHPEGDPLVKALTKPAKAQGTTIVKGIPAVTTGQTDYSALVAALDAESPDAIVLSTPAADVPAIVAALAAAGHGPEKLWFTADTTANYAKALPAGSLTGSHGVLAGAAVPSEFAAQLRQSDPGIGSPRFAAEAYDATVLAALAAVVADDDGGPAIGRTLRAVSSGGIPCSSFGECADVLGDRDDIDYVGMSGPVDIGESGGTSSAAYAVYVYGAKNTATPATN